MDELDELEERVKKFNSLQLPGQPMSMHMGTSYLVNDLWREVQRLRSLPPLVERIIEKESPHVIR